MRGERVAQFGGGALQWRHRIGRIVRGRRQQPRHPQQHAEVLRQHVRPVPQPVQRLGIERVGADRAPEIRGELLVQLAFAADQLRRVERLACLQRVLGQHPAAETVDREHRGEVDLALGAAQARAQGRGVLVLQLALDDAAGQRRLGIVVARRAAVDGERAGDVGGQDQALAQARAQLLGRRLGEGHREDLAQAQAALDHQPGDQRGEGEGLAGAGAGLDQAQAVELDVEVGIVGGGVVRDAVRGDAVRGDGHAVSASQPSTTASNTMPAIAWNSRPSSSSPNGSRPRSASRALSVSPSL